MKHFFQLSELSKLAVPDKSFDVRFINTDNMTVAFNELKAGAEVPEHTHIHETIDFVQEGTLQMTINNETVEMNAGAVARVPSNIPHKAIALTDCKVINIFYPAREDFGSTEN
jgi:quercetin dioxygenase-like cupin family protein